MHSTSIKNFFFYAMSAAILYCSTSSEDYLAPIAIAINEPVLSNSYSQHLYPNYFESMLSNDLPMKLTTSSNHLLSPALIHSSSYVRLVISTTHFVCREAVSSIQQHLLSIININHLYSSHLIYSIFDSIDGIDQTIYYTTCTIDSIPNLSISILDTSS